MYYFFIGPVLLPVTPGSMETSKNGNNETVNLINESEINILKEPGLDTISFDATGLGVIFLGVSERIIKSQ